MKSYLLFLIYKNQYSNFLKDSCKSRNEKLLITLSFIKGKLEHLDYLNGCDSSTNSNCETNPELDKIKKKFYNFYVRNKHYMMDLRDSYKHILPPDVIKYFKVKVNEAIKNNTDNYTSLSLLDVEIKKKLRKLYKELRKKNTT